MLVYRLEDGEGSGVFKSDGAYVYRNTCVDDSDPWEMPCAFAEPEHTPLHRKWRTSDRNGFRFAFSSLEQLEDVFSCPVGRRAMASEVKLNVYEVPDNRVFVGEAQCIFVKDYAKLLDTLNVETLEKEMEYA